MYNSKILIFPDGLFINTDLLFYFGSFEGISEAQFICMVDGIRLRGTKSEKHLFISIDDAVALSLREARDKSWYGLFRKELAVEFQHWKDQFERGETAFFFSDDLVINLEVYLSHNAGGKWSSKALKIVRNNRPDLFSTANDPRNAGPIRVTESRVYFIKGETSGNIKIGHSQNPTNRLRTFQTGSSEPLILLKTIAGGERYEKELQKKFAHLRIRNRSEWYKPASDLLTFIDSL